VKGSVKPGRVAGSWYLRVELERTANGARQRRRETFMGTKREAESRLRDLLRDAETGGFDARRLTVSEIVKGKVKPHTCSAQCEGDEHRGHREGGWLASVEARIGARTFARYSQIANDYIIPALGAIRGEALRPTHVETALAGWRTTPSERLGRPLSARSIRHAFDTLRTICRWAVRMGLLVRNPCDAVAPPRWDQPEMVALDAPGVRMIAVMPVPHQGLGEAINDRLLRGQAPRG